ncbi:MAG: beta-ribofuranosylaminobenzene 5'-phosphate synthase family protein [Candidatus Methylomirabilales bacterium]
MASVTVTAPARLHLGFIDPEGLLGRRFGSLGVAINEPRFILEARTAPGVHVEGDPHGRVEPLLRDLLRHFSLDQGVSIRCRETVPAHVGLGSGTQLSLAVATAVAHLFKLDVPLAEMTRLTDRGRRSGIGVSAFAYGGFVLDAGRGKLSPIPTVLFRHPFPEEWRFVVVVPELTGALHGVAEEEAFQRIATPPPAEVGAVCRLILMQLLPALIEKDVELFGEALTTIQRTVGGWFAPIQGGIYGDEFAGEILELMTAAGAAGVGQSSWGPTLYGLAGGADEVKHLKEELQRKLKGRVKALIFTTAANNQGATVEEAGGLS